MANYVLTQTGQEVQDILDSMGATYFFSQTATFASDNTYADYPYKGTISLVGVDGTMGVEVSFSNDQAISGNYSPICNTTNDAVEIWSKVNTSITIPTIKIYKNGYVNLNGSSNYMPQSGGNFTGAITVNGNKVITGVDCDYNFVVSTGTISAPTATRTYVGTLALPAGINFINMSMVFANNSTGYRQVFLSTASDVSTDIGAHGIARATPISGTDFAMNANFLIGLSTPFTYYVGVLQNSGSTLAVYPRIKVATIKKY